LAGNAVVKTGRNGFDLHRPDHIQSMKAIFPWLFFAFFAAGTFGQGSGGVYVRASGDGRSWAIGNDSGRARN
jgi:hypothetical protein